MAWTMVETPNAKYILVFSLHEAISEMPKDFDATIIESGRREQIVKATTIVGTQYEKIVDYAMARKKEVWITDAVPTERALARYNKGNKIVLGLAGAGVATTASAVAIAVALKNKKVSRRTFLLWSGTIGTMFSPLLSQFAFGRISKQQKEIKNEELWNFLSRYNELISGKGVVEIRNALTAEKAENFIAPLLQKKLGRKPIILMVWGAGHYGITRLLHNQKRREKIIEETNLSEYLKDFNGAIRIKFDGKMKIELFSNTLKTKKQQSQRQARQRQRIALRKTTRREFFKTVLGKRKLA